MRQEPKMYESTKPKDAAVDTDVVEADITDDGFHDMVNRFFKWIGNNIEFVDPEIDNKHHKVNGFSDQHDSYGYGFKPGFGYGYGYGASFDDGH